MGSYPRNTSDESKQNKVTWFLAKGQRSHQIAAKLASADSTSFRARLSSGPLEQRLKPVHDRAWSKFNTGPCYIS